MNVLIACEESQAVCTQFRIKGHDTYSCDILPCTGGHPEWHIKDDVLKIINGDCTFITMDGLSHTIIGKWDMIIAFPPCTHLAVSGAKHFEKKREDGRQLKAIEFFNKLLNAECDKIVVENPVNIIGGEYIKKWFPKYSFMKNYTQKIQPYEFGEPFRKTTCLWLKGVKELTPTNIVEPKLKKYHCKNGKIKTFSEDYGVYKNGNLRSKTYPGIAKAMAERWG